MTEPTLAGPQSADSNASPIVYFGGMLGVAACSIGIAIFLCGCFGFSAAFSISLIPMFMSGAGLLFTILGGIIKRGGVQHTGILAGVFINLFGLVGALIEVAFWQNWPVFPRVAG